MSYVKGEFVKVRINGVTVRRKIHSIVPMLWGGNLYTIMHEGRELAIGEESIQK